MKISVKNLSFSYSGTPVFDNFSAEFESGGDGEDAPRPLVILGPSGSGKTTLLKLLGGLLTPQKGEIVFIPGGVESGAADYGKNREAETRKRNAEPENVPPRTSFIFQEPRLLPWLTVLDNITLPLEKVFGGEKARERALDFLSLVSLDDKAASYPAELSGGEAQRVSLARAFAWPSPALFMDEPFQSLDIPLRISLMNQSLSLLEKEKRFLAAVTHDPREAVYLGGRIIVLGKAGRGIVFDRNIDTALRGRGYLSASNDPAAAGLEADLIKALEA